MWNALLIGVSGYIAKFYEYNSVLSRSHGKTFKIMAKIHENYEIVEHIVMSVSFHNQKVLDKRLS